MNYHLFIDGVLDCSALLLVDRGALLLIDCVALLLLDGVANLGRKKMRIMNLKMRNYLFIDS